MNFLSRVFAFFRPRKATVGAVVSVKSHRRRAHNKIVFTDEQVEQMAQLKALGISMRQIGRMYGCSHVTVMRRLEERGAK